MTEIPQQTILFVEDEPDLRGNMREALAQEGFNMIEASDRETALTLAREKHPNLVLLDLILPGGGGFKLLEAFRDDKELSAIPVVVLTNLDDTEHIERALALGARSYLVKTHYALEDVVKHILGKVQDALDTSKEKHQEDA